MSKIKNKPLIMIIAAISVCILLFAAYFIIRAITANVDPDDDGKNAGSLIDTNSLSVITAVEIRYDDRSVVLGKKNGVWYLSENERVPVSSDSVNFYLKELQYIVSLREIEESENDISVYGLDKPSMTVTLSAGSSQKKYVFGNSSSYYDGYYFKISGKEHVYIVQASLYDALRFETEDILGTDPLPAVEGRGSLVFTDLNGDTFSVENESELYNALLSLEIGKFIDFGDENYPVYNLDKRAVLSVDGSDYIYFSIGETDDFIYMLINDSQMIYTAKTDMHEVLVKYIKGI